MEMNWTYDEARTLIISNAKEISQYLHVMQMTELRFRVNRMNELIDIILKEEKNDKHRRAKPTIE